MSEPELEWCLVADGLAPAALTELCGSMKEQYGRAVAVLADPQLPTCEVRVSTVGEVELRARLADHVLKDVPIEMSSTFRVTDDAPLIRVLASRLSVLLTRTVRYSALVSVVRSKRAIAFIGSGLSKDAGYPDWRELLGKLVAATGINCPPEDLASGGERALAVAQKCRDKSTATYYDVLSSEFGEKAPGHETGHVDLLLMPFASYMTTNIDPCLDLAAERAPGHPPRKIQVWPMFVETQVGGGDIFFLNGKVPRPGQQCTLEQIRLTTSDYKEAYQDTPHISDLITLAMKEGHSMVFIGYGLREPAITEVLKVAWKRKKEMAELVAKFGYKMNAQQAHFALLPEGEAASDELAALLRDCNIEVIDFPVPEGSFEELKRLLVDLFRRTTLAATPSIRSLPDISRIDQGANVT